MKFPFIHLGDNLEFLKTLDNDSIDLIYSDILYGTGKNFADYEDIKPDREVVCNFYRPRLQEMHRILKPTGSIYLQMDYRIVHWVRCVQERIFDYDNFVNEIIWCYSRPSTGVQKNFTRLHDNILFFAKTKGQHTFNTNDVRIEYSEATKSRNKYGAGGSKFAGTGDRKCSDLGKIPESYWNIPLIVGNARERVDYYSQKPLQLIERIVKASSNEGDIVADFFMGSGTTAVVCKDLNRKFIGCDINQKAVDITLERLNT